jgi:outer membrane protein assembly factor BamB
VSCSFDDKTGIWKDAATTPVEIQEISSLNENVQSRFETVFQKNQIYNEEIKNLNTTPLELDAPTSINNWVEKYGLETNNISNFLYSGDITRLQKSSKLSKRITNNNIIFYNKNLITSDHKGKIFTYSLNLKKKFVLYDFYKKKFKNFKKKIYLTVSNNVLYAADNLGYIYAIDLIDKSLVWAKNYGIPFRSNLKIIEGQIILANQDNTIYSINFKTGVTNWQFSTGQTSLKSDFENNFVIDKANKNLFFLNTSGEFYSINYIDQKINWLINFKDSSVKNNSDLFLSHPIVFKNDNFIISTEKGILNYNSNFGNLNWSFPSDSILKPILTNNYVYIFSKNNLLICLNNKSGDVLWSKNIYKYFKNEKINKFYDFKMVDNEINLFSSNGYLLSFNHSNGNLEYIKKISKKGISSAAVFVKENMLLIDNKNKLLKFN